MRHKGLNRTLLFNAIMTLLIAFGAFGQTREPGQIKHVGLSNADRSASCMDSVLGKRTIVNVDEHWLMDPCPNSRAGLLEALKRDGLRLFEAGDFAFVIPSKFFPPFPPDASPSITQQIKWNQLKILAQVRPAQGMDQKQADDIGRQILERARLIPLSVSEPSDKDGTLTVQLNIYLYQDVYLDSGTPTSIVALVNQLPVDGETGRFVYGEVREGKYSMLWDSPLFSARGNPDFEDVNGDGLHEILFWAHTSGNMSYPILVIFDKDGRELTGSNEKACYRGGEGWACEIGGTEINLEDSADGKKEIQVRGGTDGKDHVFKLVEGLYVAFPPFSKPVPLADKIAIALNDSGMDLMKEGDYERAAGAFVDAAWMTSGRKDLTAALFANNAGFAYYKMGKYEESIRWLKAAIEDDPKRAVAYLNLGDAYAKLNRNVEARQAYAKYLELAPNSKAAPVVKKKLDSLPPTP